MPLLLRIHFFYFFPPFLFLFYFFVVVGECALKKSTLMCLYSLQVKELKMVSRLLWLNWLLYCVT